MNQAYYLKNPTIVGENAVAVSELPIIWQRIAEKKSHEGLTEPDIYVQMAQLFLYKLRHGDLDIFNKRSDFWSQKEAFCSVLGTLAWEALEFFGQDFQKSKYPDFSDISNQLNHQDSEYPEKQRIVAIASELFKEFGYDFPASFYWCHLAPLNRGQVCEIVPLRFSEEDKINARAWDANLHGQKVFPIQMRVQSISSQKGFVWLHGCGCNHGLSRVGEQEESFTFEISPEMRRTWVRDFIWTVWYEYAYFDFVPVTRLMTGKLIEFDR